MKVLLSTLKPGQFFTVYENTYVVLSRSAHIVSCVDMPCLRLTGGSFGPAWQIASFEDIEVELCDEGED